MTVSLYFQLPRLWVTPASIKSVNCFNLLYLFCETGRFDEFGWANGSGNFAVNRLAKYEDTRAKLKISFEV